MKVSRSWLQNFFDTPLPSAAEIGDALTFHAFEIESVEDDILDVKITANRGHDCLCHRGIAKELSAILRMPLNQERDPFARMPDLSKKTDAVKVSIADPKLCKRYIAGYIKGVKVGPSPDWLKNSLEVIGQKSINNVVDATNLVMFNTGQPMHAFDAGQLFGDDSYAIEVRMAKKGEKMLALDDKEYELSEANLVIADANSGKAIGVAGVKGGKPAGITEATTDIILEAANFDGVSVRKTAQALKLRTDASARFEQVISPELAAYGMQQAVDVIAAIAGGEVVGFVDEYPAPQKISDAAVSVKRVNEVLGTKFSEEEIDDVFTRLGFAFKKEGDTLTITPPFERLDLVIPEDLIEEVGRIIGYDKVPAEQLPAFPRKPEINQVFAAAEKARERLIAEGYSEVYTSVFADSGERAVANKVDSVHPYLRANLADGLKAALEKNVHVKDLLGAKQVRIFEIGVVWRGGKEITMLGTADEKGVREKSLKGEAASSYEALPFSGAQRYQSFSKYPFISRDIALWVPADTKAEDVLAVIRAHAGDLLIRSELFDEFKKGEKVSYAFRLIFQSFDTTLTDHDANERMESIYTAVKKEGWEVR